MHSIDVIDIMWTVSGVARLWGAQVQKKLGGPPFPSPTLHPPSPSPPLSFLFPSPAPLPAAKLPPKSSYGSGERCKLPQRGLGRSPSRSRIWCILALKSVIWGNDFNDFPKIFLWPPYSGAPGARGPRFIEPPEPPAGSYATVNSRSTNTEWQMQTE